MGKIQATALAGLLFATLLISITTFARTRMVDGIDPDTVVQALEMKGPAQYTTTAGLISDSSYTGDPRFGTHSLVIVESQGAANYLIVDTKSLSLEAQTQPQLALNKSQSLLVTQNNEHYPSRNQWARTLTISYIQGKYVISGFTYSSYDKLDPKPKTTCDYNLLTGKGVLNGKSVRIRTKAISLEKPLAPSWDIKFYTCQSW